MKTTDAILNRHACKDFDKTAALEESTLKKVLAYTQRAPTCFNSQPWVAIVVRRDDKRSKNKLVEACFATNQKRVSDAAATVLFCADTEPTRNLDKITDLSVKMGYDREAAHAKVSKPLTLVGTHVKPLRWIIAGIRVLLFPILGLFTPVMTAMVGESSRTWAIKQTMMAASTFMLAATSHDLATCPMEGFDAQRARTAVGLPRRFLPAVMICIGPAAGPPPAKPTLRFPPNQVYFDGHYTKPFEGIEPVMPLVKDTSS